MKSYVDTQITTVTTAWTANAVAQATELVNLDLKIISANSYAINNVTGANAAIQSLNANIGSYYIYANANVAGLQGQIIGANIAWTANAATQQGLIQATSANIGSYYTYANANVAGLQSQIVGANSSIQSLSANIGSYYTYANANVAGLQGQITGANSSIQSLSANVGSFYTYANTTFVTTGNSYGNGNVAAYLSGYSGNVTAGNVITNNYRFANGAPLSFSTLASGAYTANLTTGGVLQAPAVQSDGAITTQGPVVLTYSGATNTLYKIAAVDVNNMAIYGTRNTYFDTTLLTLNAATGNATVSGNVVAPNYLFANGVNILSTVSAGSYGNTQVAQFLPTYTGNVSAGNAAVTSQFTVPFGVSQTATDIQRIILAQALIA
jgi:roadblock/LC7 domain-containing protein